MPFVYIAYFFAPCLSIFNYWESPMCKFMGDVVSYSIFLTLLVVSILRGEERSGIRVPNLNSAVDVTIWIWVCSYAVEEIRTITGNGLSAYFRNKWLIFRCVMTLLFLASFVTRIVNVFIAADHDDADYRHVERELWPWNDPMLVSEALFCIAVVMAFMRVINLFQISQVLGPLQITLSLMMYNICEMFAILFVVMFAFACGLTRLYYFYEGSVRVDDSGMIEEQQAAFTRFEHF